MSRACQSALSLGKSALTAKWARDELQNAVNRCESYLSATPAQAAAYLTALEAEHAECGKHPIDLTLLYSLWYAVEAARKGGEQ